VVSGITTAAGTWEAWRGRGRCGDEKRIREMASMGGVRREAERKAQKHKRWGGWMDVRSGWKERALMRASRQ
jgi:hypothetical protein